MKQRLGIAMAIIKFPKFLILDEPTNGLDPEGMHEIRELLKSLPKQYGMTLLVSSHILSEMEQISKTLGIIKDGKLLYQGTLNSLMAQNNYLITTNNVDLTRNILNDDPYSSITSIDNRTVSFSLQNPDEIANIAKKLLRMMASYTPCIKRTNHLKTFFLI
nr:AAA family ATPase [Companilactobacillus mishanensis]